MTTAIQTRKVLYTARVHTAGNRDGGVSRSDDGRLDIAHGVPGKSATGTNPEQLLAAGWSACFQGAMGLAAGKLKVGIPAQTAVDAEVDLVLGDDGFSLQARLHVSLPGLSRNVAQALIDAAQETCPYSKAMAGNVNVQYLLV
ncbi:organic hydroperoxide resistance protein [Variovorax sp. J22R133]|uniref:organic hydroperoxide resistance protein n=1 Tax=Variovorax brevis TaxID=3053503 RepID=UPI0025777E19|nr:organic hydroperoxide resistance protein [Variovorax sp. J22R133]MDM0117483.1 organic hydroperoxide resistance protein [Variovorax sp. J22R133]